MDITVLDNGSLRLKADADDQDYLRDHPDLTEAAALLELTEPYWTNGGFEPFDAGEANPFVGLTSAPCIAEALSVKEDGQREVEGRLWWFPAYETVGVVDTLREKGEVIFSAAPAMNAEATPDVTPPARRRRAP